LVYDNFREGGGGAVADRNRVSDLDPDSRSVDLDPDSESGSGSRMTKMAHANRKNLKSWFEVLL
jgi:hypothetical protein